MRSVCSDLVRVLPGTLKFNRGKLSFSGIVKRADEAHADKFILIERWKGGPGRIRFCKIVSGKITSLFPILILGSIKTQIDFSHRKKLSKIIALMTVENASNEVSDLAHFLSDFLGIPFVDKNDLKKYKAAIHLTHLQSGRVKIWFTSPPLLMETGPRLILKKMVWRDLGERL
jgi:rRNA maturation protein Rpf1